MARLRYAGLLGTIGSGGLTNSATSHTFTAPLTYAAGVTVPALTGSDYFLLSVLDGSGNLSEVVKVTAYTSSTGAATIVRGQEATSGAIHSSGDVVTMAAYPSDLTGSFAAFAAYAPTITATITNPALGTGAIAEGRYCQIGSGSGSFVQGRACFQFGSGMSQGSGVYRFLLPVAAYTASPTYQAIGSGSIYCQAVASTIRAAAQLLLVDATHAKLWFTANAPSQEVGAGAPGAFQNGDSFTFDFTYEAA